MPYDEQLAERVRAALAGRTVREVRMFGGLSFMVDERLTVAADSHGRLMLKIDPSRFDELVARPGAAQGEMRGRSMGPGWLVVDGTGTDSEDDLGRWVGEALAYRDSEG